MSMSHIYRQGLKEISRIDPEFGPAFIDELNKVSPDFAQHFVEFAFGSIYSRSVIDCKVKELIAIANLIVLGQGQFHLKVRIIGAMRMGCSKEEILEVIIQSVVYVGFFRALAALNLARQAFEEHSTTASDESPDS